MAKKKPIKLNDQQLMLDASRVADIYHQMTIDLFDQVVDRIRERGTASLEDNPYIWQLEKMSEMGLLNNANIKLIAEYSGVAEEQLRYVIENEGYKVYKDTKSQLLEALGGNGDFITNNLIQTNLANYVNQTTGDIDNLINTTTKERQKGLSRHCRGNSGKGHHWSCYARKSHIVHCYQVG